MIIPEQISHYRILGQLGAGGMGVVWRAHDTRLNREVALKVLPADFANDAERMHRFMQEARAASALNHPNIITIHENGQSPQGYFLVSEFVEGVTLRQRLTQGTLPLREVLEVVLQVSSALNAAHGAGIVHRDIKPENIMLRRDGYVKVLDFGLAKLLAQQLPRMEEDAPTLAHVHTQPGVIMGTFNYMSPEQVRGESVDNRSDLFSLGILLYELLTARAPFDGESASEVIGAILHLEPPPVSVSLKNAPPELNWILAKALAKDQEERYQTAKSFHSDLKRLKQRLDFERELERSVLAGLRDVPVTSDSGGQMVVQPTAQTAALTTESGVAVSTMSSAEYLVTEIKQHRAKALTAMLFLFAALSAAAYWLYANRQLDSLAVLPVIQSNTNANVEALSDELTSGLIRNLSMLSQLSVKPFSSVARYKGKELDALAIGKELGVKSVLALRLVPLGENFSINAELIETDTNRVLWGEQYQRRFADLATVKEDISREITEKLRLQLNGEAKHRVEMERLYEAGRYHWNKRTVDGLKKAMEYFNQLNTMDAAYAPAFAGMADCYLLLSYYGSGTSYRENLQKAKSSALKSLSLDDNLAEAHTSLAQIHYELDRNLEDAKREFKRAIELNPSYATAHQWYAEFLAYQGYFEESIFQMKRAEELEPLSRIIKADLGNVYYFARDYERAQQKLNETLKLDPNFSAAHWWLGQTYTALNKYPEAAASYHKALTLSGENTRILAELAYTQGRAGHHDEARKLLEKLLTLAKQQYISPSEIALVHIGLGEKDQAFAELNRAAEESVTTLSTLSVDPMLDSLRADPRFKLLAQRIGIRQ